MNLNEDFKKILEDISDFKKSLTVMQNGIRAIEQKCVRYEKKQQKKRKYKKRDIGGICKPVVISDELCSFIGKENGTEMARTEVTKYLIQYIKDNNLQEEENKKNILPDEKLKNLLKVNENEEVNFFNLQKYMNPHFTS
jgi:chromatin remodeling complex protein RSC6